MYVLKQEENREPFAIIDYNMFPIMVHKVIIAIEEELSLSEARIKDEIRFPKEKQTFKFN